MASIWNLPPEILIAVLVHVDFQTVLYCRQVGLILASDHITTVDVYH